MKSLVTALSLLAALSFASAQEHEWFPEGSPTGAEPVLTDVSKLSGPMLEKRLKDLGGMYLTGRTKTKTWENAKGDKRTSVLYECVYWTDTEHFTGFVHAWRGRNSPFDRVMYNFTEVIHGEEPKIKGSLYEKTNG